MRRLFLSILILLSLQASAVEPESWTVTSTEDFLAGEMDGMAIGATGELLPGPAVEKLAGVDDPFVFSQASAADGTIYIGTGNEGKVYRFRGGKIESFLDTDEQQVHALAIRGNDLFVGSSPYGKIYRVDLRNGSSEVWADLEQAYIWDIEPGTSGELFVATGLEGKLYKVSGRNQAEVLFDAPEMHLRSLALLPGGAILAGGSGEGRIYEVSASGEARALYDSSLTEISSLYHDSSAGVTWAAAGKSVLPTTAPQQQQQQQQQQSGSRQQNGAQSSETRKESASVSVSFSFDEGTQGALPTQPTGSSELYRIDREGNVEIVWRLDREIIYSIDRATAGKGVIVSTGANGRIYRVEDGRVALMAQLPEKQVVSYRSNGARGIATTTNAGALFALDFSSSSAAMFQSSVKDTRRISRFGEYTVEGHDLPNDLTLSWRSGNTSAPDETWSEWAVSKGVNGTIAAPAARYLQWKIDSKRLAPSAVIESVTSVFVNRNLAPNIDSLGVAEPAVVFITGAYPSPPGVVEATNPDQYGIFTSLDTPATTTDSGKKYYRKGYRTVNWKATDPNNDTLRYDLHFRRRGMSEWLRLREKIQADQMNFDTSQLPDGEYELKLTASDEPSNPVEAKSAERSGVYFTVDNTAPVIRSRTAGGATTITIEDALSPVTKVEYSVNAEEWKPLLADDGISDSRSETYRLPSTATGAFVIIRAVDSFYNVATSSP